MERTGEAYTKLKELSGNLANVEIATHVTAKDGEKTETYEVTENFTMKWASQRIYMMDYERTMTELFTGDPICSLENGSFWESETVTESMP